MSGSLEDLLDRMETTLCRRLWDECEFIAVADAQEIIKDWYAQEEH